jgi:hypothetical protein
MAFNDELRKAGVLRGGDGLQPRKDGKLVRFDGRLATSSTSPSRRSGGRLPSIEDAAAWVKRRNPMPVRSAD